MITDYREIIDSLKRFAKKHMTEGKYEAFQKEFESFLKTTEAKSKSDTDDKRSYKGLLNCGALYFSV